MAVWLSGWKSQSVKLVSSGFIVGSNPTAATMKYYICKDCKKEKSEIEFYVVQGYRRHNCRKCASTKDTAYAKIRRRKYKQKSVNLLGGKCSRCEYNKCLDALEFHHIDSKMKDNGLGDMFGNNSWKTIEKELKKCILLCANCHREEHSIPV